MERKVMSCRNMAILVHSLGVTGTSHHFSAVYRTTSLRDPYEAFNPKGRSHRESGVGH